MMLAPTGIGSETVELRVSRKEFYQLLAAAQAHDKLWPFLRREEWLRENARWIEPDKVVIEITLGNDKI